MIGQININQFPSIQALYHLEDLTDSSGNGNTLTNNNSVTFPAAKFGNGADLGASNTNKALTTTNSLNVNGGAISVLAWIKLYSTGGTLLSHANAGTAVEERIDYDGTTLSFERFRVGIAHDNFAITTTLGTGWHHFGLTYDGATVRGYLDGNPMGNVSSSGSGNTSPNTGFALGGLIQPGGTFLDATRYSSAVFDEVLITSANLTAKQIKEYYSWASGRKTNVA